MNLVIDSDVKSVLEFMQERVPACRLVAVANGVQAAAPLLWGHLQAEELKLLRLVADPIAADVVQTQSAARE